MCGDFEGLSSRGKPARLRAATRDEAPWLVPSRTAARPVPDLLEKAMSHDPHVPATDSGVNDEDSRVDARSALTVLVVTVFGFLLVIGGFDGALGVLGLL